MSKPDQNIDHSRQGTFTQPRPFNGVEILDSTMIVIADDHVQYITELTCERDQLLARIAELESTVLKLQGFVDAHYNRIRES